MTGVAVMPVIFAVLLAHTEATRSLRDFTIQWQHAMLDAARERLDAGADLEEPAAAGAARLPVPIEVGLSDFAAGSASGIGAKLEREIAASIEQAVARGEASGDSARLRGAQVFSWRALPDRRILLALSPAERLQLDQSALWTVFALLLLVSTGIAALLGWLLAQDVSRATESLRGEAERLSLGDLRRGEVYESEDELGELSRSFEAMGSALRATVVGCRRRRTGWRRRRGRWRGVGGGVVGDGGPGAGDPADDGVDGGDQPAGAGIADSSQTLNVSVEESSSSILELGAAGRS